MGVGDRKMSWKAFKNGILLGGVLWLLIFLLVSCGKYPEEISVVFPGEVVCSEELKDGKKVTVCRVE